MKKLEKEGHAIRNHEGAYFKHLEEQVRSFTLANQIKINKNELIARKSLEFIVAGDTIILDSGINYNGDS